MIKNIAWLMALNFMGMGGAIAAPVQCATVVEDEATREAFKSKVDAMRERVSGFDEFLSKKEIINHERKKGYRDLKRQKWDQDWERIYSRLEHLQKRDQKIAQENRERIQTYNEFARNRGQSDDQKDCARKAYIVQRDRFLRDLDRARTLPEEVELGLKPYRPNLRTRPPSATP